MVKEEACGLQAGASAAVPPRDHGGFFVIQYTIPVDASATVPPRDHWDYPITNANHVVALVREGLAEDHRVTTCQLAIFVDKLERRLEALESLVAEEPVLVERYKALLVREKLGG